MWEPERGRAAGAVGEGGAVVAGDRRHGPRRLVDEAHAVVGIVRHGDGAAVRGVRHVTRELERGRAARAVGKAGGAAGDRLHGPRRHVDEADAVVVPVRHGDGAAVREVRHANRVVERGIAALAVGKGGAAAAGESSHLRRCRVDGAHAVVPLVRHGDGAAVR